MQEIIDLDKRLFLFLNRVNHPYLDFLMFYATQTFFWLPVYLFLIFLIFKKYKQEAWFFLLGAALVIAVTDQVTSTFMKPYFARLRPSHDPSLAGLVHVVNGYTGGLYGFASSHAANTFGMAILVWLALKSFYPKVVWIFVWAALMAYTRIYLGVHFPADILVGAAIGLVTGWIGFTLSNWMIVRYRKNGMIT